MTGAVDHDLVRRRLEPLREVLRSALPDGAAETTWLVGGVVRDALLDRPLPDIDLAIAGDPEPAARAIARALGGTPFPLGDRPGDPAACWRVVLRDDGAAATVEGDQVDICSLRGGSLTSDLAARDFTANAMAVPLSGPIEVVDEHGGLRDVHVGAVRMVAASAFDDDPLRMLRAARFAHVLGWDVDPATTAAVRARAARASEPAGERTFAELERLLRHPEARRGWRVLGSLGLEDALLPELVACRGLVQSRFHHLDVYEHTLAVLDNCEDLLSATDFWLPLPTGAGLTAAAWTRQQQLVVLLAALFHDLGKPATHALRPDGAPSFVGHDEVGAGIVDAIAERWRLSGAMRQGLHRLVATHLALGYLLHGARDAGARWRFLRTVSPVAAEAVVLSVGDRLATAGAADRRKWVRAHLEMARAVWVDHWREQRDGRPVPLLDGRAIAEVAGVAPGPALGALVTALAQAQAVGEVTTVEEARAYVLASARQA